MLDAGAKKIVSFAPSLRHISYNSLTFSDTDLPSNQVSSRFGGGAQLAGDSFWQGVAAQSSDGRRSPGSRRDGRTRPHPAADSAMEHSGTAAAAGHSRPGAMLLLQDRRVGQQLAPLRVPVPAGASRKLTPLGSLSNRTTASASGDVPLRQPSAVGGPSVHDKRVQKIPPIGARVETHTATASATATATSASVDGVHSEVTSSDSSSSSSCDADHIAVPETSVQRGHVSQISGADSLADQTCVAAAATEFISGTLLTGSETGSEQSSSGSDVAGRSAARKDNRIDQLDGSDGGASCGEALVNQQTTDVVVVVVDADVNNCVDREQLTRSPHEVDNELTCSVDNTAAVLSSSEDDISRHHQQSQPLAHALQSLSKDFGALRCEEIANMTSTARLSASDHSARESDASMTGDCCMVDETAAKESDCCVDDTNDAVVVKMDDRIELPITGGQLHCDYAVDSQVPHCGTSPCCGLSPAASGDGSTSSLSQSISHAIGVSSPELDEHVVDTGELGFSAAVDVCHCSAGPQQKVLLPPECDFGGATEPSGRLITDSRRNSSGSASSSTGAAQSLTCPQSESSGSVNSALGTVPSGADSTALAAAAHPPAATVNSFSVPSGSVVNPASLTATGLTDASSAGRRTSDVVTSAGVAHSPVSGASTGVAVLAAPCLAADDSTLHTYDGVKLTSSALDMGQWMCSKSEVGRSSDSTPGVGELTSSSRGIGGPTPAGSGVGVSISCGQGDADRNQYCCAGGGGTTVNLIFRVGGATSEATGGAHIGLETRSDSTCFRVPTATSFGRRVVDRDANTQTDCSCRNTPIHPVCECSDHATLVPNNCAAKWKFPDELQSDGPPNRVTSSCQTQDTGGYTMSGGATNTINDTAPVAECVSQCSSGGYVDTCHVSEAATVDSYRSSSTSSSCSSSCCGCCCCNGRNNKLSSRPDLPDQSQLINCLQLERCVASQPAEVGDNIRHVPALSQCHCTASCTAACVHLSAPQRRCTRHHRHHSHRCLDLNLDRSSNITHRNKQCSRAVASARLIDVICRCERFVHQSLIAPSSNHNSKFFVSKSQCQGVYGVKHGHISGSRKTDCSSNPCTNRTIHTSDFDGASEASSDCGNSNVSSTVTSSESLLGSPTDVASGANFSYYSEWSEPIRQMAHWVSRASSVWLRSHNELLSIAPNTTQYFSGQ